MYLLLLVIFVVFYRKCLGYHYVCDDLAVLDATQRNAIPKPKSKLKYLWMMFRGQAYWGDRNPVAHIMPVVIHFITCVMIYVAFGRTQVSAAASLLFALHPVNTEVSVWMSAKHYGIAAILALLAWWYPGFALLYLIPSTFISGIFAPLLLICKGNWTGIFAIVAVYTIYRGIFQGLRYSNNQKMSGYKRNEFALHLGLSKIVIALKFYGYFLVNCVFGLHYAFYHHYMDDYLDTKEGIAKGRKPDIYFFVGLLTLYILLTNLACNYNLGIFGLLWATVNVAMWLNLVNTGQQYIANRYYYLANVGICLFIAYNLAAYPYLLGILLGWYARQLVYSVRQYQNVYWHFFYQISDQTDFYYSYINMGNFRFHRGEFKTATDDFEEALNQRPHNFKALFNLSGVWLARGNIVNAVRFLEASRKADVYGQEESAANLIKKRMELINSFIENRGKIKLKITDIQMVA